MALLFRGWRQVARKQARGVTGSFTAGYKQSIS